MNNPRLPFLLQRSALQHALRSQRKTSSGNNKYRGKERSLSDWLQINLFPKRIITATGEQHLSSCCCSLRSLVDLKYPFISLICLFVGFFSLFFPSLSSFFPNFLWIFRVQSEDALMGRRNVLCPQRETGAYQAQQDSRCKGHARRGLKATWLLSPPTSGPRPCSS